MRKCNSKPHHIRKVRQIQISDAVQIVDDAEVEKIRQIAEDSVHSLESECYHSPSCGSMKEASAEENNEMLQLIAADVFEEERDGEEEEAGDSACIKRFQFLLYLWTRANELVEGGKEGISSQPTK